MRYILASKGFINGNILYNKKVIIDTIKECSSMADFIIFGEAFLQGFEGINFDIEHDRKVAIKINDEIIEEISNECKSHSIAVSFGFIEILEDRFYSSQLTIDRYGNIIDIFRHVSPGWKEEFASFNYVEGDSFHTFQMEGITFLIGLCGDFWYDENIEKIAKIEKDLVLWPVYTDYNYENWNNEVKYEYKEQAKKIGRKVLYVNSYCIDKQDEYEVAKGGAIYFKNGEIFKEVPSGKEGLLFLNEV